MSKNYGQSKAVRWLLFGAILILGGISHAKAEEPLSEKQKQILAEIDARWWGWSSEPSPILPAPQQCKRLDATWELDADRDVLILTGPDPSPQEAYIAEMLKRECIGKHHLRVRVVNDPEGAVSDNPVICLGTTKSNPQLKKVGSEGQDDKCLSHAESYAIDFTTDASGRRWVAISGGDPVGCIHGGYSFMQLIKGEPGHVKLETCRVRDWPTVSVRSLRGVGESLGMKLQIHTDTRWFKRKVTADEIHPDELVLPCLDRLARNRINCYQLLSGLHNGPKLPERLKYLVEESHRRGIKVVGGFRPVGAQNGDPTTFPCYCNEEHMRIVLGHFRQYIEAGCDFLYFMADDYYRDKYPGHCEKCIARFGNLAGEQVYMLRRIVDLAKEMGISNHQILFCPTHYDARSPRDVEYLKAFNDDPQLRGIQFTFTYLTEDVIEERKQSLPNLTYALFYNGPRWLAYYGRRSPNTRGVLANYSRNAMYFPIYYGWHAAQYDASEGWFVNTTDAVRDNFHVIIPRETKDTTLLGNIANYSDSIFKGPVEYALWGHYCWHPKVHDTRQSEEAIGDFLFGPGNGKKLARLNRVLLDLTRVVYEGVTPPEQFRATLPERFALAKRLHGQFKAGYEKYAASVPAGYIPETQDFHARLGIEDMAKYLAKMEQVVQARGLLSGGEPLTAPLPRYAGVIFPAAGPDAFHISGGCQGGNLTGCLRDLWKYGISDDRWKQISVPQGFMSARCGHSAVPIGDRVFFFGGTEREFTAVRNSLHVLDLKDVSCTELTNTSRKPPARLVHAACAGPKGRMWIFGGLTTDREALGDLWCYDPESNRWQAFDDASGDQPGPRYGARLACAGGHLYLFGGNRQNGPVLGDLYRFDPAANTWSRLDKSDGKRPSPCYAPAFLSVGERLYLFGGGDGRGGYFDQLHFYDCSGDRWEKLEPQGKVPGPRGCALPLCLDGNRIYLFSGAQSASRYGSWINGDLYVYDIAKNEFSKLQSSISW